MAMMLESLGLYDYYWHFREGNWFSAKTLRFLEKLEIIKEPNT
jgi:hypothetical protein